MRQFRCICRQAWLGLWAMWATSTTTMRWMRQLDGSGRRIDCSYPGGTRIAAGSSATTATRRLQRRIWCCCVYWQLPAVVPVFAPGQIRSYGINDSMRIVLKLLVSPPHKLKKKGQLSTVRHSYFQLVDHHLVLQRSTSGVRRSSAVAQYRVAPILWD